MPPPLDMTDPLEARPFMDPYGRAKTVRIGKWRWPPPQGVAGTAESAEDFMQFKMRQNQRKTTPQSQQNYNGNSSSNGSNQGINQTIEWEEFDVLDSSAGNVEKSKERFKSDPALNKSSAPQVARVPKRSFDIGAERPTPGSVGKLKLSTEMRQRLEQVTAGHSVRSTSNKSDVPEKEPVKLDNARRMMLEQQLGGMFNQNGFTTQTEHIASVRTQIQRMEATKIQKPFMPPPSVNMN